MENLGARLRHLRQRVGLSQRALAKIVGVSNGTISVIENGDQDPTVGLLKKLVEGLNISMSDFFGELPAPEEQYFFKEHELVEIGTGKVSYKQVRPDLEGKAIQMIFETYGPGANTGPNPLTHEGEESGIIISGQLEIQVGNQIRALGPGEAYYFPSTIPHKFRNTGNEPCVLVSACTPPTF
jgi:transcriptional regulator with XRE-family HTH domain